MQNKKNHVFAQDVIRPQSPIFLCGTCTLKNNFFLPESHIYREKNASNTFLYKVHEEFGYTLQSSTKC